MNIIGPLTGGPGTLVVTGINGDIMKGSSNAALAGDVIGPSNANTVISITGQTGTVTISSGSNIQWAAGTTGPMLTQATATSDVPTQNLTISPQAPYASAAGTNRSPGNLILSTPAVVGGGTGLGHVIMQSDGYTLATYGNAGFQFGRADVSMNGVVSGIVLTPDQYCRPYINVVGTLTGSNPVTKTITFPQIDGAMWWIGCGSLSFATKQLSLQVITPSGTRPMSASFSNSTARLIIYTSGTGRLSYLQFS